MFEAQPPNVGTLKGQFFQKYGRKMTLDEIRFYKLTKDLLDNPPEDEEAKSA